MATQRLTISVPQPCHENWQEMTPQLQGRFCQNCQKTVVDFTAMSDAEVVKWLSSGNSKTCGRFKKSQLDKHLVLPSGLRPRYIWKTVSLILAAWLSTKSVKAHSPAKAPATFQTSSSTLPSDAIKSPPDSAIIIKGKVVDGATQETMPGATVQLKGMPIAVSTQEDGVFILSLPAGIDLEKTVMVFSFIGYDSQEKPLKYFLSNPKAEMVLSMTTSIMGELVVIRRFTPRGLYYSARSFFGYTIPNLFR